MTNATKTLGIIFVSLAALFAFTQAIHTSERSEIFQGKLVEVDTAAVDRLQIMTATDTTVINLQKDRASWKLKTATKNYEADAGKIERALAALNDLSITSVVTRNPEKHSRYKVDSTGTIVTLYEGETKLEEIYIGAPQIIGRQEFNTYVRKQGSDDVFAVEGFLSSRFSTEQDSWRDKNVWNLDENMVTRVDFEFPGDSSFSMIKSGDEWISDEDTLKSSDANSLLSRLTNVNATGFTGGEGEIKNPLYLLNIHLNNGDIRSLYIAPLEDEDNESNYQVSASDYPYIFTVNKSSWDSSVLQGKNALIREDE